MSHDTRRRVLITGAGQGIGLEWARQELRAGSAVLATARDPEAAPGLRELERAGHGEALTVLRLDVTDDASVDAAARAIEARGGAVDELINNAGTFGPRDDHSLATPPDEVRRILETNAVGPYRVTRRFLPLLKEGREPRIIFMTSRMGSIGDHPSGAAYAYRMSKSALNMLGANLARDLREARIVCLILHPGWVQTRMGGARAPLPVTDAVTGLRRVVSRATLSQSGSFLDHSGAVVPW